VTVFLDTNVLVYAFDASEPAKRARAVALLEDEALDVVVSAQVLNEFYWTATRKLDPKVPEDVAEEAVRGLALGRVVPVDAALVEEAIALARRHHLSLWDAGIVVAAQRAGCHELLTEDLANGQAFGGVRVRDPFA
jgi:predicted nucleic acid-binding protein